MYALSVSAEGDCYWCVPPDPGIATAALGASGSGTLPSTAPAQALHTFTSDSGASRCFFCYSTTLNPLPAPVPVRLADPSGGLVVARSSTVLPCPAVPSSSLSGLHLPLFSTNLVSTAALQDAMVTTTTPGGQRVSICTCTRTGRHLATFTRQTGSSLYTLATEPPQVAMSLPPLPPSPAPPCLPCIEGQERAAPHSSSFTPTTAPLQTLHMDVWGPTRVIGQSRERYFLLVVDDYTRYTTVFPLHSKGQIVDVLMPWIRTVGLQLCERFGQDLPVLRLHSDRGGEFSSNLLRDLCHGEGILQSFKLPDSPQQCGIAERRIGLVMEVARTLMIHAAAPHFLWPFAVRYTAHQLNLWPHVSLPEISPTLRWTGKVGDASVFRFWGSPAFVRDTSADKLSACAIPCLGFVPDTPGWQFYHPSSRRVLPSQDVTFDESVPFYRLFPYRSAPLPPPPLFLAPRPPPVDPLPPQGPAPSGVSQVDQPSGAVPRDVVVDSGAARGIAPGGAEPGDAEPGGAEIEGAAPGGAESRGAELEGVEPGGAQSEGAESRGAEPQGAAFSGGSAGASLRLSPHQLRDWLVWRAGLQSEATGAGGAGVTAGTGGSGGTASTGPRGARIKGTGAAGTGGAGGAGAGDPTEPGTAGAGGSGGGGAGTGAGGAEAGGTDAGGARVGGTGAGGAGAGGAGAVDPGGTMRHYVDIVLPIGANIVDGMWIFRVKRPPGSPPAFKGSLHEEIWLPRPPGFTGSFPAGTQWSLRRPIYGLCQAPREWHDTLRTTLAALGFAPCTADLLLFLRTDTSLPPFCVLVYIDDLVFAFADTEALTLVKSEMQKRHTYTDLGELRNYLGLQITRDRARRTITLTQSHMVHQVLPRFGFLQQGHDCLCQEHRLKHRTKHFTLKYFLARELQQRGQLPLAYVATRANTADVFTKALPPGAFAWGEWSRVRIPVYAHVGRCRCAFAWGVMGAQTRYTNKPFDPNGASLPMISVGNAKVMGGNGGLVGLGNVLLVEGLSANLLSVRRLHKSKAKVTFGPISCRAKLEKLLLWDLGEKSSCIKDLWQLPIITWNGKLPATAAAAATAKATEGGEETAPADGALDAIKKVQQPQQPHGEVLAGVDATAAWAKASSGSGEADWETLKGLEVKGAVKEIGSCPTCLETKFTTFPFSSGTGPAKAPLALVHMDVVGPTRAPSLSGSCYFLTIVDDHIHVVWVYPLKTKGEVAAAVLKEWMPRAQRESGHKAKVIRTGNGGEFIGADFEAMLKKKGIQHQLTVPYNPQQNCVAERFNRTLQEGARTLLGRAGLPDPFWVTALQQVALVKNRVLATVGDKQWVPYTKWYGSAPAVNMLRAYGCMMVFHVPKEKRGKLEASGRWGVHLGLAKDHKGWLILDLTSQ
ncbi:unnamed protein product [Closterium sp. NIES-54]